VIWFRASTVRLILGVARGRAGLSFSRPVAGAARLAPAGRAGRAPGLELRLLDEGSIMSRTALAPPVPRSFFAEGNCPRIKDASVLAGDAVLRRLAWTAGRSPRWGQKLPGSIFAMFASSGRGRQLLPCAYGW